MAGALQRTTTIPLKSGWRGYVPWEAGHTAAPSAQIERGCGVGLLILKSPAQKKTPIPRGNGGEEDRKLNWVGVGRTLKHYAIRAHTFTHQNVTSTDKPRARVDLVNVELPLLSEPA